MMKWQNILLGILLVFFIIGLTLFFTLKYFNSVWQVIIWIVMIVLIQVMIAWLMIAQNHK